MTRHVRKGGIYDIRYCGFMFQNSSARARSFAPEAGITVAKTPQVAESEVRRTARLQTPTDLRREACQELAAVLTRLLADLFALYVKTKNFHWHVCGPHFRDYHLLLDEQASQIFDVTDLIAERVRKIGGTTIRSIRHVARLQRLSDNDADFVTPLDMLGELRDDNSQLASFMREAHCLCDQYGDVATASLLENWIDEAETRVWFLFAASRVNGQSP